MNVRRRLARIAGINAQETDDAEHVAVPPAPDEAAAEPDPRDDDEGFAFTLSLDARKSDVDP